MPTARTTAFLVTASLLYFFANQTQVGWIYVMSALMAGTVLAAWWLGRGALKRIAAERQIAPHEPPHEGDTVSVQITFRNTRTDSHIRTTECCPFAPPDSPARALTLFIPWLSTNEPAKLNYEVIADRRGLHEFPPLRLESPAPFGLFRRSRRLSVPTRVLIYPEVRPLHRVPLFDRQPAAVLAYPRPGFGAEIIGVRPFRSGDPPRHIHWRSTARTRQLISKEFADDSQPGLTLALDLYRHPFPATDSKHTPFEWAVKVAASLGDYAQRRQYALHLLADDSAWSSPPGPARLAGHPLPLTSGAGGRAGTKDAQRPPPGPLSVTALLEYLARIQPTGQNTFSSLLSSRAVAQASLITHYVIAILPWPDLSAIESLAMLRRRRCEVMAVVIDPQSFPAGGPSARALADGLTSAGVESQLIEFGRNWAEQLEMSQSKEAFGTRRPPRPPFDAPRPPFDAPRP